MSDPFVYCSSVKTGWEGSDVISSIKSIFKILLFLGNSMTKYVEKLKRSKK